MWKTVANEKRNVLFNVTKIVAIGVLVTIAVSTHSSSVREAVVAPGCVVNMYQLFGSDVFVCRVR
jgi:energy-converting hydrogenase Eha subunit G